MEKKNETSQYLRTFVAVVAVVVAAAVAISLPPSSMGSLAGKPHETPQHLLAFVAVVAAAAAVAISFSPSSNGSLVGKPRAPN